MLAICNLREGDLVAHDAQVYPKYVVPTLYMWCTSRRYTLYMWCLHYICGARRAGIPYIRIVNVPYIAI